MTIFIASVAAFILGVSKSGLKGLGIFFVAFMALAYGAKASTGIILPLLLLGDMMASIYYKRHCQWKYLYKILPAMMVGVVIAVYVGVDLPEAVFKKWMAVIILLSVVVMFWRERKRDIRVPNNWLFGGGFGLLAGFTTMIGNLGGPATNIFFLATGIPKKEFIGTAAWLYLVINAFKIPFHAWVWGTINKESLLIDAYLIIPVFLGFAFGLKIVKRISERFFRHFILILTALGAIAIFFK